MTMPEHLLHHEWPDHLERSGNKCEFCGSEIVKGQHYVRLALMIDTAGLERTALDVPEVPWSGIFCTPVCAGIHLAKQASVDEVLTDVFGR